MTNFQPDLSGINSLGGFSYQIKVFIYYLSMLQEQMQLEFEKYDDVSFSRINPEIIDEKSENFKSTLSDNKSVKSIQVKRTKITNDIAKQTLLNWILLEVSEVNVSEYILFTDKSYNNVDKISDISCENLFSLVKNTKKSQKKSTIGKVKEHFGDNFKEFQQVYEFIMSKYTFKSATDLEEEIAERYKIFFRKAGLDSEIIFYQRVKALLDKLTSNILEKINENTFYSITFEEFMKLIEHISNEISDDSPILDYMSFKRMCSIDINDLSISNLREFKQLKSCELTVPLIENNLTYGFYYEHSRLTYSELNKVINIENLEVTAFDNFNEEKHALQRENKDNPYNRLNGTKKRFNSYADNDQIKYGVVIYLTKENIGDKQISWEDD